MRRCLSNSRWSATRSGKTRAPAIIRRVWPPSSKSARRGSTVPESTRCEKLDDRVDVAAILETSQHVERALGATGVEARVLRASPELMVDLVPAKRLRRVAGRDRHACDVTASVRRARFDLHEAPLARRPRE